MRILAGVLLIVAAAVAVFALPSSADDAPGCDGLAEYRDAMFAAADPMVEYMTESGISSPAFNPLTLSSSDWSAYADEALAFHDRIAEVEPPAWATDWHALKLDMTGAQEQVGRAAATGGVMVAIGFAETLHTIEADTDAAEEAIAETCPDFAQFAYDWDALDGSVDGTPVATPIR